MAKTVSHKHVRQDLKALLEERNQQNAFLRSQLAARVELTANLEARLLSTLDTLDDLQATATRDLEQVQRENAQLKRRIEVAQANARDADIEKSEMSFAVLQLVGKVESCNDYSRWRASRIEFSHDIDIQLERSAKPLPSRDREGCSCPQVYSPVVVEELSDALLKEKRAHALSIEEAERRITTLQARLAVREAELSKRVAICCCLPMPSSSTTSVRLELMSEEEQARIAELSAERNRILESEIGLLEEKLARERRSRKRGPLRRAEQSVQTDQMTASFPSPSPTDDDAVPAALNALDSHIEHLRKSLKDLLREKDDLRSALRKDLRLEDPLLLASCRIRQQAADSEPEDARESKRGQDEFKDVLLLEEECIRLMRSEDNLRASLEHLQRRNAFLTDENMRLRVEISRLRSFGEARPAVSPPSLPPLDTSAIDLAFPPLQPDMTSPAYATTERGDDEPPMPGPSRHASGTGSSSSASSTSLPATPTSLIDPSEVPLPITPTFDDIDAADDVDGPSNPVVLLSPQEPAATLQNDSPLPENGRRDVEAIERELANARAEAEMREREIAEVRDFMTDLANRVGGELQDS